MKVLKSASHSLKSLMIAMCLLSLSGCLSEAGREGRPLIDDLGASSETGVLCGSFFLNALDAQCVAVCPTGTVEANEQEKADLKAENNNPEVDSLIDNSIGVCIAENFEVTRPNEKIETNSGVCGCLNSAADTVGDCAGFCAGRNTDGKARLFVSTTPGPDVLLNDQLGDLFNWCNVEIDDGLTGPNCQFVAQDANGNQFRFNPSLTAGNNNYFVDVDTLAFDTTFIGFLEEQTSKSRTKPFQFERKRSDDDDLPETHLKIMAVNRYACVRRTGCTDPNDPNAINFDNAVRNHFYFAANNNPPVQPPGDQTIVCHDPNTGLNDSSSKPRLDLQPSAFSVWDKSDIRFVDINPQDGKADINTIIEQKLLEEFGLASTINLFVLFPWPNSPQGTTADLGLILQPFVNPSTNQAFCPDEDDYQSTNPTFRVLSDVVGVPTEGIFMSEKDQEPLFDCEGNFISNPDILLIRESDLKKVWFFFEEGQEREPDEITATTKTIQFYFPFDFNNPLVKKPHQRTYTVRNPGDIGGNPSTGLSTSITPADKRFGCIPKQSN